MSLPLISTSVPAPVKRLRLSVVVPSYRRPDDLRRCLVALSTQRRSADSIIVVARADDRETIEAVRAASDLSSIQLVKVEVGGQVAALNAGWAAADGDIVCITDDDTAPHDHWLETVEQHFLADPELAGLGGRDHCVLEGKPELVDRVGIFTWWGDHIGNHHRGKGAMRPVDILKGANMSYRKALCTHVAFDRRLKGAGAQVGNDMKFSLDLRKRGLKLAYDPLVSLDHFTAPRHDDDTRSTRTNQATKDMAFNESICALEYLPRRSLPAFLVWMVLVGSQDLPGAIRIFFRNKTGNFRAEFQRFLHCQAGRLDALKTSIGRGA